MGNNDNQLIRLVLDGDTTQFNTLAEKYISPLLRHVTIIVKDADLAEDIVQDTLIKAYQKLGTFDPDKSQFKTWLYTIATRRALDSFKRKSTVNIDNVVLVDTNESAETQFRQQEIRAIVDKLPENYRTIVSLHYWQGMRYEEIADVMNTSTGTIKGWMYRAKLMLKESLQ